MSDASLWDDRMYRSGNDSQTCVSFARQYGFSEIDTSLEKYSIVLYILLVLDVKESKRRDWK